jgi:hypothetical protein
MFRRQFACDRLLFFIAKKLTVLDGYKRFRCVKAGCITLDACDAEGFPICGFAAQNAGLTRSAFSIAARQR